MQILSSHAHNTAQAFLCKSQQREIAWDSGTFQVPGSQEACGPAIRAAERKLMEQDDEIEIFGLVDQIGARWVGVRGEAGETLLPFSELQQHQSLAFSRLIDAGHVYLTASSRNAFLRQVESLSNWSQADIADRVGWQNGAYVLGDGTILGGEGKSLRVSFKPELQWSHSGTVAAWREQIAEAVSGQPLPMFVIMLAFAPPLLSLLHEGENFGFELVGPSGKGKTTLQRLASSVWGSGGAIGTQKWWRTWSTTLNAIEDTMRSHNDALLVLDEAQLLNGGRPASSTPSTKVATVFQLAQGHPKARLGEPQAVSYRLAYLSSSNTPLIDLTRTTSRDLAEATGARLISIPVPSDGFGAFASVPEGFESASDYAQRLGTRAGQYYGSAIRAFLAALVRARAADEAALKAKLQRSITTFVEATGVDRNDGAAMRVVNAFAAVYAAGRLARSYGVLPKAWRSLRAALLPCYQRSLALRAGLEARVADRVQAYITNHRTDLLNLDEAKPPRLSVAELSVHPGFLRTRRGRRELMMTRGRFNQSFPPDPRQLLRALKQQGRLRTDGGRQETFQAKRTVREGHKDRMICIRV